MKEIQIKVKGDQVDPKRAKSKDKTEFVTRVFIRNVCATKRKSRRCKRKKKEET